MSTLTPEQLDMIKRLQPFFKEKMGEWQVGDEFYNEVVGELGAVHKIHADGLECFYYEGGVGFIGYRNIDNKLLRIPKPIDWQNPERGLWGMITSSYKTIETFPRKTIITVGIDPTYKEFDAADPFTALLTTLCEQERV